MALGNVLLFFAFIFAVVWQCCGLNFSTVTMANSIQVTDAFVSHKCVLDLKGMSADCNSNNLLEVPQDLPANIQKLNLAFNHDLQLRNVSFVNYPLLNILDLRYCSINYIERGAFYPLKELKKLGLRCALTSTALDRELFRHSVDLQHLDIRSNGFRAIPYAILHIPSLTSLWVDDNELSSVDITCPKSLKSLWVTFNELSSVNITCGENIMDKIDLSSNNIQSILPENFVFDCQTTFLSLDWNPIEMVDPDVIASIPVRSFSLSNIYNMSSEVLRSLFVGISKSTTIQEVYLTYIDLYWGQHIPPDLFDPLCNKTLTVLDLRFNEFFFQGYIFSSLTYVSTLYFTMDGDIRPHYFDGMVGLRKLVIYNYFGGIKFNPFNSTWQINITHLQLEIITRHHDHDALLTKDAFKGLDSLMTLAIIDRLPDDRSTLQLQLSLPNIQHLYLTASIGKYNVTLDTPNLKLFYCGDVPIGRLNCTVRNWEGAKSLEEIHMSHALTVTSTTQFQGLCNLTLLIISYNHIQMISPGSFVNLSLLEVLDLSANLITTITSESFRGLVALQVLKLEQNQLIHFSGNSLRSLTSLTYLHLDGNNLTSLHKNLFAASNTLTTLTLSYNQFVSLNSHTFDPILPTVKTVDISGNPLVCNCENQWLVDNLGRVLVDANETLCSVTSASLKPVRGKAITLFVTARYCSAVTPYLVTIFGILSVFAMSIMLYRSSYVIRYKLYLLKLAIIGYVEIQDARDRDDFEYDINIMFMENDEAWARDVFRPQVQETLPEMHRIAFGDDDLTRGMYYFDAVCDNVENSFKTVLLLSRVAVQDHIFMSKLRIALNHVTDTQTENMVLVFIEDIPDAELPYLVRLYQTGHGEHLRWEEDEESQEYFWYRLSKIMPVNLKINFMIPS